MRLISLTIFIVDQMFIDCFSQLFLIDTKKMEVVLLHFSSFSELVPAFSCANIIGNLLSI